MKTLSYIAPLIGPAELGERYLFSIFNSLDLFEDDVEFIFICDGPHWATMPMLQFLKARHKNFHVVYNESERALVAELYNQGAALASGSRLVFGDVRLDFAPKTLSALLEFSEFDESSDILYVHKRNYDESYAYPVDPSSNYFYTWLLNGRIGSIASYAIPKALFDAIGGFNTLPFLQRDSDWDLMLRLALVDTIRTVKIDLSPAEFAEGGALEGSKPVNVSSDIVARYMSRRRDPESRTRQPDPEAFLRDLPARDARHVAASLGCASMIEALSSNRDAPRPLKVTITGGPWEYHHNRLCFYSYFEDLEGQGFGTYKILLDEAATNEQFDGSDIVIISRGKSKNVRNIIRYCRDQAIPTVYMIDDNWFTVAADWPEAYSEVFGPQSEFYTNFVDAIETCDYVLTYNPLLADDLEAHAKEVLTLPNSVNLAEFESHARPSPTKRFVIGFTGSPRYVNAPFEALAKIALKRPDVDVILFATLLPDQEALFEDPQLAGRVKRRPQQAYSRYVEDLRKSGADILIAPLDASRTSQSKCPNKFLEITAAGAVGVYTDVRPYSAIVKNGKNGVLLPDGATTEDWMAAIEGLLDRDRIKALHTEAHRFVAEKADVPVVARAFSALLQTIATAERRA